MKKTCFLWIALLSLMAASCSENTKDEINGETIEETSNYESTGPSNVDDPKSDSSSEYYEASNSCPNDPNKEAPGECGCGMEDKDINGDGKIDCPVKVMPAHVLIDLEDIPGTCAEWAYPKHHNIAVPALPAYGYEVTIDTEKYGISTKYDPEKADATTNGLNKAIKEYQKAGYTRIVIPPGHYPINGMGIRFAKANADYPGSNLALIMSKDVILQKIPDAKQGHINISDCDNIYIEGGTLLGNRYEFKGGTVASGAIVISASGHVFVNGVTIKSHHGDGIQVRDYSRGEMPRTTDIIIANTEIDDSYRHGIAVVGVDGLRVTNSHIHHSHGSDTNWGIDFEPDPNKAEPSKKNFKPILDHNVFNDNEDGDLVTAGTVKNIFIEYNSFSQGEMAKYDDGPWSIWNTTYVFYRNKIEKFSVAPGCSNQLFCSQSKNFGFVDPSFMVENDLPAARVDVTNRNKLCIKGNVLHEGLLTATDVREIRVLDNRVEKFSAKPKYGRSYGFWQVKGKASGNVVCKKDNDKEVCTPFTEIDKMKEDEPFDLYRAELWGY